MSRRIVLTTTAAFALAGSALVTPAHAAGEFPITVNPTSGHPTESLTVTGDATDPVCEEDGVAVSLHYTKPNGNLGATTVNTTTDAAGHFSVDLTVPADAYAGERAFVSAVIADCNPPGEPSAGSRASESEEFEVLAYEGDFAISKKTGRPGEKLEFAGTNCWGGEVAFFFGDVDALEGKPEDDRTFAGEYVLPDAPDGTYQVTAECPGTDYAVLSFRLVNPAEPAAPPAPPAVPVPRRPTFTG